MADGSAYSKGECRERTNDDGFSECRSCRQPSCDEAQASGHGGDGGGGGGFRGNHFSSGFGAPGDGYRGYDNRVNGLRGESRGYGARDMWGHRGAYYGPMVPTI
jgi:hypothetical protein